MIEDRLLIYKLKSGESDALRRTYEKYKDSLLRLACSLLSDTSAAEDVVHDCFIALARSTDRLRLSGSLKGYLMRSVINRVRNRFKAKAYQAATALHEVELPAAELSRPEQWIVRGEQMEQLNAALGRLPYEQREVVTLHLQGEMRFRAIAKSQGVSINTVQSRYRYGIDKLRSLLNKGV
ncbi:MAG: RNA polymerase sigma factor [Planctomycetota bacterium]|jgi:RNA polymerase sigma-70 factor (ECF subfamily)